jgi:hypothetical protein
MLITWNPEKEQFQYLITNLDAQRYPFHKVYGSITHLYK